jgi:Predicted membrane protein
MKKIPIRKFAYAGLVGAAYAALTMLLYPISYGPVQFRVSEVLCILPFFDPIYAVGLFVGCVIANLISTAGVLDIVFGSLATLAAGLCTAWIGRGGNSWVRCIAGCAMPVIWNGLVVGAVLAAASTVTTDAFWAAYVLYGAEVAGGEAVVLYVLGLPLLRALPKQKFFLRLVH